MAAGGRTAPYSREQAEELLRRLAYQIGRAAKAPQEDEVHDLRVAIRRFTQAAAAFRASFPAKAAKRMRRKLKELMDLAGNVRNCDVAVRLISHASFPAAGLRERFRRQRRAAEQVLRETLQRWLRRHSYSKWRMWLGDPGGAEIVADDSLEAVAARTLPPLVRDFFKRGDECAHGDAAPKQMHRLRIATKRLRYTLELFVPVYGEAAREWLDQLRGVQTALGTYGDCETVGEMVSRWGRHSRVQAALKRRQQRATEKFRSLWAGNFSGASAARRLTARFSTSKVTARKPAVPSEPPARAAAQMRAAGA
jgi:CHAD domain-containing protein